MWPLIALAPLRARRCLAAMLALATLLAAPVARSQPSTAPTTNDPRDRDEGDPSYDGPVLPPGRESEVRALLRPFEPGGPLDEGWSIGNVAIRRDHISVELKRGGAVRGAMRLEHPSVARGGAARLPHLSVRFEPPDIASIALRRRLIEALRSNDRRSLWSVGQSSRDVFVPRGAAARAALDGALLSAALLAFLLAALRRHTRDGPRWLLPAALGVAALGLGLRLALSPQAPMNAWPYSRVVPLAGAIYSGGALGAASRAMRFEVSLVDLIFSVDLALAALTPAALFVHARAMLRDHRVALAAALLLATLPSHLRFSRSDVEFLQSLLLSSLAFTALYGALTDDDRRWRVACSAVLPALCLGTYLTRPENLVFFPLDLAAFAVAATGATIPRRRVLLVGALVAAPAALAAWAHLFAHYRAELAEGLSRRTLQTAWETLRSTRYNTLINPSVTPPWVTAGAVLGLGVMWRSPLRRKGLFLLGWLAVFFVVHSYIRPHEVAMQARYHLHLVTPLILLAASVTPALAPRAPWLMALLAALSVTTPWLYRGFVRDTAFYEMREFAFLRRETARVPRGCRVIEFRGVPDAAHPAHHFDSRLQRFANRLTDGTLRPAYDVVTADEVVPGDPVERVSREARALLEARDGCVMLYLGLSCVAQRPVGTREAPICEALRTWGPLERVASETITGRVYDSMNIGHPSERRARVWGTLDLLPPGTPVRLELLRFALRQRR
ncbi:MAG: hypothetical protein R3A48_05530 [Polyangiales bacterium]